MKMTISVALIMVGALFASSPAMAQPIISDPEETKILIEKAEVTFIVCDTNPELDSDVAYYNELECDHNILFLKGQCENSNNTAYNWCYNADMERYLNARGIKDAPRPPDAWCNMFVDECIEKWEAFKDSAIELSESLETSESTQNLVEHIDDEIQKLEDKRDASQGEIDNDIDD